MKQINDVMSAIIVFKSDQINKELALKILVYSVLFLNPVWIKILAFVASLVG